MSDLWLIANQRTEEISDAETVRLGRVLVGSSARAHVWYPRDEATAIVVVKDYTGELLPRAASVLSEVLGAYREEVRNSKPAD